MRKFIFIGALIVLVGTAHAAPQTTVLTISGMRCGADPHIVRKALADLPGVADVQISLDVAKAVVSYDNDKVSIEQLLTASGAAGYPAHIGK